MKKIKAFIERANDGTYNVYIDLENDTLNYGIFGEGSTVKDSIEDFMISYKDMKELYEEENKHFVEAEFEFKYDTASFLSYYGRIFSLAGLQRITGINQGQLSHYVTGHRKPSPKTVEKIEKSIHAFANEISQVHFV